MKTTVIIPYTENKNQNILLFLSKLKDEGILLFIKMPEKLHAFHDGKDLFFEIPTEKLPLLLRDLDDSKYVYKPDSLKLLASRHLAQKGYYNQIWENNKNIEIFGMIYQTGKEKHFVVISYDVPFLTEEKKEKLKAAIESILIRVPEEVTKCDIDIQKIQYNSIGVQEDDLVYAIKKWTANFFGLDINVSDL